MKARPVKMPWRRLSMPACLLAAVAQAGDTVTIRAGVYREWVKPANAGREGAPITYRAAKGERVVVTGADEVRGWTIEDCDISDCFLEPENRVTRSTLRYSEKPRAKSDPKRPWFVLPTVYSGPAVSDPLQPSGRVGQVVLKEKSDT